MRLVIGTHVMVSKLLLIALMVATASGAQAQTVSNVLESESYRLCQASQNVGDFAATIKSCREVALKFDLDAQLFEKQRGAKAGQGARFLELRSLIPVINALAQTGDSAGALTVLGSAQRIANDLSINETSPPVKRQAVRDVDFLAKVKALLLAHKQ